MKLTGKLKYVLAGGIVAVAALIAAHLAHGAAECPNTGIVQGQTDCITGRQKCSDHTSQATCTTAIVWLQNPMTGTVNGKYINWVNKTCYTDVRCEWVVKCQTVPNSDGDVYPALYPEEHTCQ
jgi:hypothetical protein